VVVDPLFWLGLSILLVAVSLTAVLVAALPAFRELARAARSAEKLFDTLSRELPPTLESIRLTGMEITDLKEDVSEGVQGAGRVVQQVDQSIDRVKKQAQQAQTTTRSLFAGVKAAWNTFSRRDGGQPEAARRYSVPRPAHLLNRPPVGSRSSFSLEDEDGFENEYLQESECISADEPATSPYPQSIGYPSMERPSALEDPDLIYPQDSEESSEGRSLEQPAQEPQAIDKQRLSKRSRL
jgi:FtsZ-binding cell division protein ZapB